MTSAFISKALLTTYKRLPTAIRENENGIMKAAKYSYYTRGAYETLRLMEKMLERNSEKYDLINLKLLMDKAFNLMLSEDMRIINMRFIKGMTFVDMASVLGVSLRQTFRVYDRAVDSFYNQLVYLKYPVERIESEFGNLPIFQSVCFKLSNDYGILD